MTAGRHGGNTTALARGRARRKKSAFTAPAGPTTGGGLVRPALRVFLCGVGTGVLSGRRSRVWSMVRKNACSVPAVHTLNISRRSPVGTYE
jgi:hypothetical protein